MRLARRQEQRADTWTQPYDGDNLIEGDQFDRCGRGSPCSATLGPTSTTLTVWAALHRLQTQQVRPYHDNVFAVLVHQKRTNPIQRFEICAKLLNANRGEVAERLNAAVC